MKTIVVALLIALAYVTMRFTYSPPLTVTLQAKTWNDEQVHVWHILTESQATYTDVADGTRCQQLDSKMYRMVGPPPIFYYHVNCNGVSGYVEIDQTR